MVTKNNAEREKVQYKWGNSGPNFWQKENKTVLQSSLRKSDKNVYELVLKIQTLDDDGKFVKNEEGTYDNGYFNFSANEVAKMCCQLELMFPSGNMDAGTIGGIIVNHISAQSNNGSQFEIVSEEEGIFIYICYVQNGEVTAQYQHQLSNDQSMRFYNGEGEEDEEIINLDIICLKQLFNSVYAMVSGLVDSTFEVNGFNINGRTESKTGGKVVGGMNRKVRSSLGSKRAESISEDDDDEDNESNVTRKTPPKKSSLTKASNMKSLLEDDDDDDDEEDD